MTDLTFRNPYCPVYALSGIRFEATCRDRTVTFFISRDALDRLPGAPTNGAQIAFERHRALIQQLATRIITAGRPTGPDETVIHLGPVDLEQELQLCSREM